jgi:hypothetical protein
VSLRSFRVLLSPLTYIPVGEPQHNGSAVCWGSYRHPNLRNFKYGIVGGADSHIAASANEEFNYPGVHGNTAKTPEIRLVVTDLVHPFARTGDRA